MNTTQPSKKNVPITIREISPFVSLHNELNRALSNFSNIFEPFNFPRADFENIGLFPSIDIVDDKEHYKIEAELPGMGQEDIKVTINNGVLNIKGEKTTSKQDKDKNYLSREIKYGFYERSIPLPEGVDIEKAKASFKKGMLWVDIPKKTEYIKGSKVVQVQEVK